MAPVFEPQPISEPAPRAALPFREFVTQDAACNGRLGRWFLYGFRLRAWAAQHAQGRGERLAAKVAGKVLDVVFGRLLDRGEWSPHAVIGPRLTLPHGPGGTVVNPSAVLGADCIVFHRVTIGTDPFTGGVYQAARCGDRVVLSVGACLVGDVRVGSDVVVGANAAVVDDVPDRCTAVGSPARVLRDRDHRVHWACGFPDGPWGPDPTHGAGAPGRPEAADSPLAAGSRA